jgi:hypothetical protein
LRAASAFRNNRVSTRHADPDIPILKQAKECVKRARSDVQEG